MPLQVVAASDGGTALEEGNPYLAALCTAPMSIASVECMAAVVRLCCPPPPILASFTGGCLRSISATSENGPRGRLVKLLCVFVILTLDQGDPAGFLDAAWNLLPELQALCIEVDLSVDVCAGGIALFCLNNVAAALMNLHAVVLCSFPD
jgi:hypothetical protein